MKSFLYEYIHPCRWIKITLIFNLKPLPYLDPLLNALVYHLKLQDVTMSIEQCLNLKNPLFNA
jgi:hypothetical protein